jgi:putative hemolysin
MKVPLSLVAAAVVAAAGAPGAVGKPNGLKGGAPNGKSNNCESLYGGKLVPLRMVDNQGTASAQYGLVRTVCQVAVNGTLVQFGVEAADPSIPTIAATMIKTAPAIDASKVHTSANPAMVYCAAYGGAEAGFVALGLSFAEKAGQTDMCVFGDGSMASAWSLAYIGWAAEGGAQGDGFLAIRDKVADAQVFNGVHVPGNIFKA